MGPTTLLVIAVAALLLAPAASSQEPPATPCAAAIVSFSPCLAHVAVVAPPAMAAPAPTGACCAAFLRAVSTGDGEGGGEEGCFCHLVRDPLLFGFRGTAAVPGPASSLKMDASQSTTSAQSDRSGSDALCAFRVFLMVLVFTAAVLITLQLL